MKLSPNILKERLNKKNEDRIESEREVEKNFTESCNLRLQYNKITMFKNKISIT